MPQKADVLMTGPLEPGLMAALDTDFTTHRLWQSDDPKGFLKSISDRVRAVVTRSVVGADRALIDALPKLEIISVFGVGADKVDLNAAKTRGIHVTTTPGIMVEDCADFAIGLMLALARRIIVGDRFVRDGHWLEGMPQNSTRVHGKRLGIVGLGRIGEAVARRAAAFAMDIAYTGPRPRPHLPYRYFAAPKALAEFADFVVLTCPGGPNTADLVDADFLKALGANGILVNIARASVVNETALVDALTTGTIKGAALDVFPNEPQVSAALLQAPNMILEPHTAAMTFETRRAIADLVFANIKAHFSGQALLTPLT